MPFPPNLNFMTRTSMMRIKIVSRTGALCLLIYTCTSLVNAQSPKGVRADAVPKELLGDWSLNLDSKEPAWLRVFEQDGHAMARMRVYIGSDGPYEITKIVDNRIHFSIKPLREKSQLTKRNVSLAFTRGKLDGQIVHSQDNGSEARIVRFSGSSIPPMPKRPDLSKVRFSHPISLFNSRDLTGWKPHETEKKSGWSAAKTECSSTRLPKRTLVRPGPTQTCEQNPNLKTFGYTSNS